LIHSAVILAFSSSSHQSQLTYNRPHTMLPALGKPLVVRMMDFLYRAGINHFDVIVGAQEGALVSYLSAHWLPDVELEFVVKPAESTLSAALKDIAQRYDQPFFIASYNSFLHANFPRRLIKHYTETLPTCDSLVLSGTSSPLSQATQNFYAYTDGHSVVKISNIPPAGRALALIDFALCGHDFTHYLATLPPVPVGAPDKSLIQIITDYLYTGHLVSIVEAAWTLQVQTDEDLLTLNKYLLSESQDAHILSELPGTVQIIPPVRIDPQVSIGQHACLGPNVYLERGSSIGNDAVVRNAMILDHAIVPAGERVDNAIVAPRARIPAVDVRSRS
jgi:NDP-sugar pyrophosphorylase family protein